MKTFINQDLYPGEFLLHKKYAKSEMLLDLVWTHSNIIADIAIHILDKHDFNQNDLTREFVIQSALLMDIGVYMCGGYEWMPGQPPSDKPYIQHGIIGAWILQQEGYSPQVIQVAHSHSGVGVSAQDVRNFGLDLPEADYVPRSQLQKLITYSSKFHSKAPKFKDLEDIKESLMKFGKEKIERFDELVAEFGEPNLEEIIAKYEPWHKGFTYQRDQLTSGQGATQAGPDLNSAGIAQ